MTYDQDYSIENLTLADEGKRRIAWARANMPIVAAIADRFERDKPFDGMRIGICLHVEAKTGVWLDALTRGGAKISITGSPGTTQDDTAASLVRDMGISVFTRRAETYDDHIKACTRILADAPDLIADNGGDLHHLLMTDGQFAAQKSALPGATEETTTGARRIRELSDQPSFSTLVINDTQAKRIVENRFGVGSSVVDGLMRATNIMLHGKKVLVVGYGYCGSGVAQRLRGMGAHVTVADTNVLVQLEAHLEGFHTSLLEDAVAEADMIITVTGHANVLQARHFASMKDGVILANAGHFADEIDEKALRKASLRVEELRPHVTKHRFADGRSLFLLCGGNPVNLAAGDGNPIEIMDLGLALQALSLERVATNRAALMPGPQVVPPDIEETVARAALRHWATL